MAHFAHLDANNIVKKVSVVSNDIETSNGPLGDNDMHVDGETWCANFHKDKPWTTRENIVAWKQTSYNNNFRKQYAGLGGTYDSVRDEFVQPADEGRPSWVLNSTNDWEAPIANQPPTDGPGAIWEEDNQRYIAWRSEEQVTPDIWNPTTSEWELGE